MMTQAVGIYSALEAARAGLMSAENAQRLLGRVDLYDETILLTRYGQDGKPATAFEVDPRDLAAAFAGETLTTGLLPKGCLWVGRQKGAEAVGMYVPPTRRTLHNDGAALYAVPLPGFVFAGNGSEYRVWAVKAHPSEESERLFAAPLPNVNLGSGLICQGSVGFPVCSVATIRVAVEMFFTSAFNADLSNGKVRTEKVNVWRYLTQLSGTETFPLEDLLATWFTVGDALRGEIAG
jgi:hypothetical protein